MKRNDVRSPRFRPTRRIAAGLAVLVVGIVVAGALNACTPADSAATGVPAEPQPSDGIFTASGVQLTDGATVPAAGFSPITVRAAASNVVEVKCVLDGVFLGNDSADPYSFDAAAPAAGEHKLRCTQQDDTGRDNTVRVSFTVGSASQPMPSSSSSRPAPASSAVTTTSQQTPRTSTPDQVVVTDAAGLQQALRDARPGMTITMQDGTYSGKDVRDPSGQEPGRFVAATSGTAEAPITLQGSRQAIVDGGGTGGGYALHLKGADHWKLQGFTVQSAAKGIVLDGSNHNVIDDVRVTDIGDEGIHFRSFSSDNLLTNSTVDNTVVDSPNYGEGVYIGSARSNWETYSGGEPDKSDRNQVINNTIIDTAAENIDIKEGSSDGVVRGNTLGGDKMASKNSADSWIDVNGNGYTIDGNHGVTTPRPDTTECGDPKDDPASTENPFCDGFQVHVILDGWGQNNTFTNNRLEVNAPGVGIWLQNTAVPLNNVIKCDNQVSGAAAGDFATNHYSALTCVP